MIERRDFLTGVGLTSGAFFSGCVRPAVKHELRIKIESINRSSAPTLNVTLYNDHTLGDEEATFEDVVLLGYTSTGERICREDIGTVSYKQTAAMSGVQATITCEEFPAMLTTSVAASGCTDFTRLEMLVYDVERDQWPSDRYERECGEELPPEYPADLPG